MLSTNAKLKCNEGKVKIKPYFQYPYGINPGDLEPLPLPVVSYLPVDSLAHYVLLTVFPFLMGVIIFTFFLISSSFIVYGVVRGLYTDHMLPRRKKVLQRLGKLQEEKRRKHFRKFKKNARIGASITSEQAMRDSVFEPHLTIIKPSYLSDTDFSSVSETSRNNKDLPKILSYTTPPLPKGDKPTVPKPLNIPGRPFPVLPDAPLMNKTKDAAGISPMILKGQKPTMKMQTKPGEVINLEDQAEPRATFVFPVPEEVKSYWEHRIEPKKENKKGGKSGSKKGKPETDGVGLGTGPGIQPQNLVDKNMVDELKIKRAALKEKRLKSKSENVESPGMKKVHPMDNAPEKNAQDSQPKGTDGKAAATQVKKENHQ